MYLFTKLSSKNNLSIEDEISGDLVNLMNHAIRSETLMLDKEDVGSSVLNYGLPALSVLGISQLDRERLRLHLLQAIKVYEPRLDFDSLTVRAEIPASSIKVETRTVQLIVTGFLKTFKPTPFRTVLHFDYQKAYFSTNVS